MSHRSSINVARALVKSFENTAYRRRDLIGLLRAEGWQLLGRGAFAAVMGHPDHPTVAIKVGQRTAPARRYRKITDGLRCMQEYPAARMILHPQGARVIDAEHAVTASPRIVES